MLRREDGYVLILARDLRLKVKERKGGQRKVEGQRKKWRPKWTWKKQVEEESAKVDLRREDALCRSKQSFGINHITAELR